MPPDERATALGAPLAHVRVIAVCDDSGAYAAKLLADLGAHVTRVEVGPETVAGAHRDPEPHTQQFLTRSQHVLPPFGDPEQANAQLLEHIAQADVVIEAGPVGLLAGLGIDDRSALRRKPTLIWGRITPFGATGSAAGYAGSDLVCSAMGGFLALAGWPDGPPTRAFGDQSWRMAALYLANGILLALLARDATGTGQVVDVSVTESAATALENALQFCALASTVRRRRGPNYDEAGTGVFACANGFVYVMVGRLSTRQGWQNLVRWLVESNTEGASALQQSQWDDRSFRNTAEAQQAFREVFERFAASLSKADLYAEGQRRAIAIAPVNSAADLVADKHLGARGFLVTNPGSGSVEVGAPYRLGPRGVDHRPGGRS